MSGARKRRLLGFALAALVPALALLPTSPSAQTPTAAKPAARPAPGGARFSHEIHAGRGVAIDGCATCHVIGPDGRAAPPTTKNPHQPCATSGCHEDQFFSRKPTICAVCHEGSDPSTRLVARYATRRDSEFGGEISHVSHAKSKSGGLADNATCIACHGDRFNRGAPQVGHQLCGQCHGRGTGPQSQPNMASCGGCHVRGAGKGSAARPRSEWSVAERFDHGLHKNDPRAPGTSPKCVECHSTIATAQKPHQIAAPLMKTCDGCHDGTRAFKTTGFGCAKCHARDR